ncbi:MAG TPA: hypothetical protein DEX36_01030 [Glutamicibacter sp.]|uniref:Uncharacterized protein n=1 Tax=Glutamicibacter arilaitensis (strain DSM 16368 / CIP 108037 / IAM 15318 / JCM 13566 / NCIMB 14258 / Re117) TaxID=861360 RepID=A0ABM9PVN1_GLUAR|nr:MULTISPECIES: hypothetical protein [Glutamicibacter]CBT75251.1 hypothetical protein AARI_10340 [Glutamicibacter arilaitensis Re117]HCH46509.1 hypothetical protein [Glutamicibacter sp.]
MTDYQELLQATRAHYGVCAAPRVSEAAALLTSLGGKTFDYSRFAGNLIDEYVDSARVVAAYDISDPELLASRSLPVEREMMEWPPEEDEDIYDVVFTKDEELWNVIQDELGGMRRAIVLLEHAEGDAGAVGNFRVAGFAQWLRETLWAATGVVPRDPGWPDESATLYEKAFAMHGRPGCEPDPID